MTLKIFHQIFANCTVLTRVRFTIVDVLLAVETFEKIEVLELVIELKNSSIKNL